MLPVPGFMGFEIQWITTVKVPYCCLHGFVKNIAYFYGCEVNTPKQYWRSPFPLLLRRPGSHRTHCSLKGAAHVLDLAFGGKWCFQMIHFCVSHRFFPQSTALPEVKELSTSLSYMLAKVLPGIFAVFCSYTPAILAEMPLKNHRSVLKTLYECFKLYKYFSSSDLLLWFWINHSDTILISAPLSALKTVGHNLLRSTKHFDDNLQKVLL